MQRQAEQQQVRRGIQVAAPCPDPPWGNRKFAQSNRKFVIIALWEAASSEVHVELATQKLPASSSLCRYKSRTYLAARPPACLTMPYLLPRPYYLHGAYIERIVALVHVEGFVVQRAAAEVLDMFCNERDRECVREST